MFNNWASFILSEAKLQERVFKGIPNSIRGQAWYRIFDIEKVKRTHPGVYEKMKKAGRQYSLDVRQIDLDVNRTLRKNITFRIRYCPK